MDHPTKPPLTTAQAAVALGVSQIWLKKGRSDRDPNTPPYYKIGKLVRYDPDELDLYRQKRRVDHGQAA